MVIECLAWRVDVWLCGRLPISASLTMRPSIHSKHFDAIFMRKDPPADAAYLYATMLLSLTGRNHTFILNEPAALREANEKLYSLNFPDAISPTIVTYEIARLKQFMGEQGGQMIVKPLDGHGGEGVFHGHGGDRNLNAILETVTRFGNPPDHGPALYPRNPRWR